MASYEKITNVLDFSVSFQRTSAFPLDARSMFGSKAAAEAAAASAVNAGSTDSYYYFGMPVVVFENDQANMYIIDGDKTLKEVGAATYGDDKTIVLDATTGKLSLKAFGSEYYAYHSADETHENAYYELVDGWKEGLEPRVVGNQTDGYSLAWYEPSTTTVEGLSSTVGSMQTSINTINTQINTLDTGVKANAAAIEILNGDETVEGSVKKQVADGIATIVADAPEALNDLKEISDWITNHADSAATMNSNIVANQTAIKALEDLVGELPEGTQATTVMGYIAEAVKAEEDRAIAAEEALAARIKTLEDAGYVASVTADGQGNITVDGDTVNVYTLPTASTDVVGGMKVDGSSITVVDGVASVIAVDSSKVTGLANQLTDATNNAVTAAADAAAELYLPKTDVVAAADAAASAAEASDARAASEKMVLEMFTWKTTM